MYTSILDELFETQEQRKLRHEREAVGAAVMTVAAGAAIVYSVVSDAIRYRVSKKRMNEELKNLK